MSLSLFSQEIYWRESLWLLLAFQPLFIIFLKYIYNRAEASNYADKNLHPWVIFTGQDINTKHLINKNYLYILAWILFSIALAGPRIPLTQINSNNSTNSKIMFVIDHSLSMKANDIKPSRIKRVKIEINEFLNIIQSHRIGITVFSARPHLFVPLTHDYVAFRHYLNSIDELIFPTYGSDYISAILFAQKELVKTKGKSSIILLTDGDLTPVSKEQLSKLNKQNISLYVLGVGTVEGEAIQTEDGNWLKHNGINVISKMDKANLEMLTSNLNGKYRSVTDNNSEWKDIYNQGIINDISALNAKSTEYVVWDELFPYFLIPAIFLFVASLSTIKVTRIKNIYLLIIYTSLILVFPVKQADAFNLGANNEQRAYREYNKMQYKNAEQIYKLTENFHGFYGQASSSYKLKHFHDATKLFISAITYAENDLQRAKALYNLGNCYFRTGKFSQAIKTYNDVLLYQPYHHASIYNLKISHILKKDVEQRKKESENLTRSHRQGRGPRSASISEQADINENTSVSINDTTNQLKTKIPLPDLPGIDQEVMYKLIRLGLDNVKLADQSTLLFNHKSIKEITNSDINRTHHNINKMEDSQHLLWKRLFEIEEGFPAPVNKPKPIPEIKPW